MELQIVGTNVDISPSVRRYIEKKLGKLNNHFPTITETKVEVSDEKTRSRLQRWLVRVTVATPGAVFHGEERAEEPNAAIDLVAPVMMRQLENHKGKRFEKGRGVSLARVISGKEPVVAENLGEAEKRVVKTKRFMMSPMTEAQAIDQMEDLGHDFFLFLDAEAKQLKLVYRRKDGNYGLIEPEIG